MEKENKNFIATISTIIIVILLFLLSIKSCKSCEQSNTSDTSFSSDLEEVGTTEAGIMAKNVIKQYLKNSDDADVDIKNVVNKEYHEFTVSMQTKNKNDFGSTIVSDISFNIKYKGGEWTDINNWEHADIIVYNENSGDINTIKGDY